jgi:hypothetical protein
LNKPPGEEEDDTFPADRTALSFGDFGGWLSDEAAAAALWPMLLARQNLLMSVTMPDLRLVSGGGACFSCPTRAFMCVLSDALSDFGLPKSDSSSVGLGLRLKQLVRTSNIYSALGGFVVS